MCVLNSTLRRMCRQGDKGSRPCSAILVTKSFQSIAKSFVGHLAQAFGSDWFPHYQASDSRPTLEVLADGLAEHGHR